MDQSIIDLLEELSDLHQPATLHFRADNGGTAELQVRIRRVEPEGPAPFLDTDTGIRIPLRQLLRVNGRMVQPFA